MARRDHSDDLLRWIVIVGAIGVLAAVVSGITYALTQAFGAG